MIQDTPGPMYLFNGHYFGQLKREVAVAVPKATYEAEVSPERGNPAFWYELGKSPKRLGIIVGYTVESLKYRTAR